MLQAEAMAAAVERSRQCNHGFRMYRPTGWCNLRDNLPWLVRWGRLPDIRFGAGCLKYTVNTGTWSIPALTSELLIFRDGPEFAACGWAATASPPSGEF
jgi:hypothetical protein